MITAVIVGAIASSALVLGGLLGAYLRPPRTLLAILLGFAAGALITAVAFDLFEKSFRTAPWTASAGLVIGALVFLGVTSLLDHYASQSGGFYLLASILLDGIPENLALGVALIGESLLATLSLLLAIFASNFPEAFGGAVGMRDGGRSRRFVVTAWTATAVLLAGMVVVGNTAFTALGESALAGARSVAAGAVLASLAEALMPQAYGEGGKVVAFATTAGFLLTFLITQ